jgi:hypothetical protein
VWSILLGVLLSGYPRAVFSASPYAFPQGDVKDDVNVYVALRLIPTNTIQPGETLTIEIHAENSGRDRSSDVLVNLFYEDYQLEIIDTHFERSGDHMRQRDDEHAQIIFDNIRGGKRYKAAIIAKVRPNLPPGSTIKVWAEWEWDYDEYNVWDDKVVKRRFKESTEMVRIPVVRAGESQAEPVALPERGFVYNIGQRQEEQLCFPETGYCIGGRIRVFWEQNGGLPVFGYPLSPQRLDRIEDQELPIQWFERSRLELHAGYPPPYDVQLGRLGVDLLNNRGVDWSLFPKGAIHPECRYFPETGHNVCGEMLVAWQSYGLELDGIPGVSEAESLALFGLPLSNLQMETFSDGSRYPVQWFERARFEFHPKNPPPYNVLFGLLGDELRGK